MIKTPRTFLVGATAPEWEGLRAYLEYTDQVSFLEEAHEYCEANNDDPLCLVSFYAKLCYKSLTEGKNANVTKIRGIEDNLKGVIASGHGSVFEHVWLNFVTTDCSRVFTHELVRHRVGTAFSQTSGRYVAIDDIDLVLPPELRFSGSPFAVEKADAVTSVIDELGDNIRIGCVKLRELLITADMPFAEKKRITSAIRRLAPNGQTNEIGWSCNVRALRHLIELRTAGHAEWEIRYVFNEVAQMVFAKWPMMLHGGVEKYSSNDPYKLKEYCGLRI